MLEGIELSDNEKEKFRSAFLKERTLILSGDITEESVGSIRGFLLFLAAESPQEIVLYIDSPGGELQPALWLYDLIKDLKAPVRGIVNGKAYSAAVVVLQACQKREATAHSLFLTHSVTKEISFNEEKLEKEIQEGKRTQSCVCDILCVRGRKSTVEVKEKFDQEMSATEALLFGLIDAVI